MGFEKFGAVKIKPPASWKPEFMFNRIDYKVTTRVQILNDLT
jgi:hypothetical protein